jgi:hypothetical protein
MLNIIQNTIGAIRRVGESVVRAGLKMWLPFTKAEPLGENLVVNGDFATDSDWIEGVGWDIDVINNRAVCDGTQTSNSSLQQSGIASIGKIYKVKFDLTVSAGFINYVNLGGWIDNTDLTTSGTYTYYTDTTTVTDNLGIAAASTFIGSIDNVSIQEYAQETPDISGNDNNAILKTGKALVFDGNDSVETSFP